MADFVGGGGGGFDYVQDTAPSNPKAGESWLDTSQNPHVIKTYNGGSSSWDAVATVTDLNNHESTADAHHSRYTDSEAASAAPVQSVEGKTGDVSVSHSDLSNVGASDHHSRPTGTNNASVGNSGTVRLTSIPSGGRGPVGVTCSQLETASSGMYTVGLDLQMADGSTVSVGSGESVYFSPSEMVVSAVETESNGSDCLVYVEGTPVRQHSHGI